MIKEKISIFLLTVVISFSSKAEDKEKPEFINNIFDVRGFMPIMADILNNFCNAF